MILEYLTRKINDLIAMFSQPFGMNGMPDMGGGPGGGMISGTWINRRTGDTINVRDSIIEGDQMYLLTDKGQLDFNIFSRDYIQVSDEMYDEHGGVVGNAAADPNEVYVGNRPMQQPAVDMSKFFAENPDVKASVSAEWTNTDVLTKPLTQQSTTITGTTSTVQIVTQPEIKNFELIKKIFDKSNTTAVPHLTIEWTNYPEKELQMLIEYFDVTIEDISEYINQHLISNSLLTDAIGKSLKLKSDGDI